MAAISGWEAVIANVGDSCAYMDTGVEVVLVSILVGCIPSACCTRCTANGVQMIATMY